MGIRSIGVARIMLSSRRELQRKRGIHSIDVTHYPHETNPEQWNEWHECHPAPWHATACHQQFPGKLDSGAFGIRSSRMSLKNACKHTTLIFPVQPAMTL